VLGRSGGCDLHVAEAEVSRHHALLWCEMGATWITDLGTANGTFVNGDPVDEPIGIAGGDVLAFGPASFVFKAV
jgi:pSer/pThr/pTyr-binding forkhead associated (FHA) protein